MKYPLLLIGGGAAMTITGLSGRAQPVIDSVYARVTEPRTYALLVVLLLINSVGLLLPGATQPLIRGLSLLILVAYLVNTQPKTRSKKS